MNATLQTIARSRHHPAALLLFSLLFVGLFGCGPAARGDDHTPTPSGSEKNTQAETQEEEASEEDNGANTEDTSDNAKTKSLESIEAESSNREALESAVESPDECAAFNTRQDAIDADAHMNTYGCPPCPCACVNGVITCAPCALCVPPDRQRSLKAKPDPSADRTEPPYAK